MMRPAFSSTKHAGAFALLLLVLLALPVVVGKNLLPPRVQAYAAQSWGSGPYPWIQHAIFEEKGDIDIAFIGSSRILHCLDARLLQDQMSQKLGRPAVVRVIGWGGAGFDALYFVTRDLLEHRKVRMLVFYDDYNSAGLRNSKSPMWFRWADNSGDLAGLPLTEEVYFYFASIVGMPRNLLCLMRTNLPADLHASNYWSEHYRSANITDGLGTTSSELGFGLGDTDPVAPFIPFTPLTAARPSDVSIYSEETKTNFQFGGQPLPAWQIHFAKKFTQLALQHGSKLVLLHLPFIDEARAPKVNERTFWPDALAANVTMLGIPPAKLFVNLSDDDVRKLYFNPVHLNKNGQEYFTSLIAPALLKIYDAPANH